MNEEVRFVAVTNREEAIKELISRGYHAAKRDWSFGESIMIFADRIPNFKGVEVWKRAVCVYPQDAGWALKDMNCLGRPTAPVRGNTSLEQALSEAVAILAESTST